MFNQINEDLVSIRDFIFKDILTDPKLLNVHGYSYAFDMLIVHVCLLVGNGFQET